MYGYNLLVSNFRLNLSTLTWETVFTCTGNRTDEPDARYRHELAFDGVNLYILAGGTAELAYDFLTIPVFSLETFTWSFRASKQDSKEGYPLARKCHSAVQIKKDTGIEVFVMGGFDNTKIFNDVWRLDIPSLQWTQMSRSVFPNPLYFHSSSVTPEGCMYTFGGIQLGRENTSRTNKLYKLWLCIPKLSEISWESLLYYYPNLVNEDRSKLLKAGIPVRFVDRLDF
jgi:Galactose oxidase, central domain